MPDEQPRLSEAPEPGTLFGRGLRLLREAEGRRSAIFLNSVVLFEWAEDDRSTRRLVAAQLVNAKLARRVEVAPAVRKSCTAAHVPDCSDELFRACREMRHT